MFRTQHVIFFLTHQRLPPQRRALQGQLPLTGAQAHAAPLQRVHRRLRPLVPPVVQPQPVPHVQVQRRNPLVKAVHRAAREPPPA